jgi:ubiquinone/menaquinone biosynthesis C-methylase UbiE
VNVEFQDYFSRVSADYARFRPTYPPALFEIVARYAPGLECAWDCATGSGQAAIGLSRHFRKVIATDVSSEQLEHATPVANVEYRVAPAEESGLKDDSVEAVTVAQALQWFDRDRFYAEVRRVSRRGAILAVWSYFGAWSFSRGVDAVTRELDDFLLDYWPPAYDQLKASFRHHDAYFSSLGFPFEALSTPPVELVVHWDLGALLGVLTTASAVQRCLASGGQAELAALYERLSLAWGDSSEKKTGVERLAVRIGRVS